MSPTGTSTMSHVQRAPAPGLSCGSSGSSVPWAATPGRYLPDFFSGFYVPRAEEGDPGKAEVLMRHEDPHRDEVWLAEVVYEAADIAVETGIYAVHLSILEGERLHILLDEVGFIMPATCLTNRQSTGLSTNTLESFKNDDQGRLRRTKCLLLHSTVP